MRIAWVTYAFEEYSSLYANALCRDHELLLVMPAAADGGTNYSIDSSIDLYAFRRPRLREPIKQLSMLPKILRRIHDFRPDVVHFQHGHMWFNLVLKSLRKYPLVVTIHDPRTHSGDMNGRRTPQWLMDFGYRQADDVIVQGQALATQVRDIFGFSGERVHVIPTITRGDPSAAISAVEDENLILFFGRIWEYKGLAQLIAAQPLINEVLPNARILIAGEGEDFGKYRSAMHDPSKFIVHNTYVSDEQRAEFFRRSALVVLPYNEASQSGVVPVAYNYCKPVVATRVGALPDCIDDGITGLLIPPRDPQAIADAVVKLLKDPERRHQMGQAGKAKHDRECSPTILAEKTVDVYRGAIAHRGVLSASA